MGGYSEMLRRVLCCVTLLALLVLDEGQATTITSTRGSGINLPENKAISRSHRSVDTSKSGGVDWNNVVDKIFILAKKDILALGKEVIPITDIQRNFRKKLGFFQVNGRFSANKGTLGNLTSFRRSADVYAAREQGEVYKMVCTLTFDDLKFRYEHYELDLGFGRDLGPRGYLEGTVDKNTVHLTLNFEVVEEGCLTTLKEVKLTELVGLRMKLSGFGELDSLGSVIATWVVERKKEEIATGVQRLLTREIENVLKDFQCDEYSGLIF